MYTYFESTRCHFHPEPIPRASAGSIIGIYPCCGEYAVNGKKPRDPGPNYIQNQTNQGCQQRRHIHMSPDLNIAASIYRKIGFQDIQIQLQQICSSFKNWSKSENKAKNDMGYEDYLKVYLQGLRKKAKE